MNSDTDNLSNLVESLSDYSLQADAIDSIVEHHDDSLLLIFGVLPDANGAIEHGVHQIFQRLPEKSADMLVEIVIDGDNLSRQIAIKALAQLGEHGVARGLTLLENNEPSISSMGGQVLRSIGPSAAPEIRSRLSKTDPSKRALAILVELDPECLDFFEAALEDAFGSHDQLIARFAIDAVATVGDSAIPFLIRLMGSSDQFKQQNATHALVSLGEVAVADIVDELDNPNPLIQQNCSAALREIGAPAIPALNDAMDSDSPLMQQNATAILSTIVRPKRGFFRRR